MANIPIIILDRINYSKLAYGITDASNKLYNAGVESKPLDTAMIALTDINNQYTKMDIDSIVKLLTEPGKKIYKALKDALHDGKVDLGDIGSGFQLIKGFSELVDMLNPSWDEVKDLSFEEIEIVVILLFREVRSILGVE